MVVRLQGLPEVRSGISRLGYIEGALHGPGLQKAPRLGGPPQQKIPPQLFVRRNLKLFDLLNEIARSFPDPVDWYYEEYPQDGKRAVTFSAH